MAAFLIPRVVDVHAFEHLNEEDEGTHCELCHVMSADDPNDLYALNEFCDLVHLQQVPDSFEVAISYAAPLVIIASPASVYNKPPPFL